MFIVLFEMAFLATLVFSLWATLLARSELRGSADAIGASHPNIHLCRRGVPPSMRP